MRALSIIVLVACAASAPTAIPVASVSTPPLTASTQVGTASISGISIEPRSAAAITRADEGTARAMVVITDANAVCTNDSHPGSAEVFLSTMEDGAQVSLGTFPVVPFNTLRNGRGSFPMLLHWNSACAPERAERATSGAVTITRADGSSVDGTFDVAFPSGRVSGSFSAPACLPSNWESLCPTKQCNNGALVNESICTVDRNGIRGGDWLTYCVRRDDGHVSGGALRCSLMQNTPSCVYGVVGGKTRAACCPRGSKEPTDPGCIRSFSDMAGLSDLDRR